MRWPPSGAQQPDREDRESLVALPIPPLQEGMLQPFPLAHQGSSLRSERLNAVMSRLEKSSVKETRCVPPSIFVTYA